MFGILNITKGIGEHIMPLNLSTGKIEQLSFDLIFKHALLNSSFSNYPNADKWYHEWMKILKYFDSRELKYLENKENLDNINRQLINNNIEYYQFSMEFDDQLIHWTLNISKLLKDAIDSKKVQIDKMRILDIIQNNEQYLWQETFDITIRPQNKETPILLLELPNNQYLVIDGNHRLTKYKKENIKMGEVNTLTLRVNDIDRGSGYFISDFEHWVFIFFIEQLRIASDINNSVPVTLDNFSSDWFRNKLSTWINN